MRSNANAYARVWRAEANYSTDGRDLPDLPASAAIIFGKAQTGAANVALTRGTKIAELEIPSGASVVTGGKTIQIEVKE